jgi:hypothetical protein
MTMLNTLSQGRILIGRMRQAKEDCWNHDSDDDPPPCSGESLGQILDRVSAIGRLLPECYGPNGDDADQDRGYKGLARRVAAQASYSYAAGVDSTNEESLGYFMSLAANDDPSVYGLVKEFEAVMPRELYEQLDWERLRTWADV